MTMATIGGLYSAEERCIRVITSEVTAEVTPNLKLIGFLTDEFLDMFELRGFCNVEVEYSQMTSCVY